MSDGQERYSFAAFIDEKGKLVPEKVNETAGRLAKWHHKKVTVTVSRYVKSKTNPQLGLYYGPVLEAWSEFTGYDRVEMHHELKRAFLAPQLLVARLTGEEVSEMPSLADLNAEQMTAFLDRVLREGRMLGIEFRLDS